MTYLRSIYVYNNFVDKNFEIDFSPVNGEPFRHLILTGNNGSGKTNTLNAVNFEFQKLFNGIHQPQIYFVLKSKNNLQGFKTIYTRINPQSPRIELNFLDSYEESQVLARNQVYEYFGVTRRADVDTSNPGRVPLRTVIQSKNPTEIDLHTKETEMRIQNHLTEFISRFDSVKDLNTLDETTLALVQAIISDQAAIDHHCLPRWLTPPQKFLSRFFLSYLLAQKQRQAYAIADNEYDEAERLTKWFSMLEGRFQEIFEKPNLSLKHRFKEGRFYFEYPDGRRFTFDQLAAGHDSILAIMMEIMLQIEAYEQEDNSVEPVGIVLIDEIENHLHISLQEKILPFLTKMFPNIQFIVTTHSPIVMASIENATVYDLSTHTKSDENLTGMEYGVLMREYLGIETVYSLLATEKLKEAKQLLGKANRSEADNERLKALSTELSSLSEDLALDIYVEIERLKRRNKIT